MNMSHNICIHSVGQVIPLLAALVAIPLVPQRASGQLCELQFRDRLPSPNASAGDRFGWSVTIRGYMAVVGAPGEDCAAGVDCGAAYVYRFVGFHWTFAQKLTASDPWAFGRFGESVVLNDGGELIIGAPAPVPGAAYVFTYNGSSYVQAAKLTAVNPSVVVADFGHSVSAQGSYLVVGAYSSKCQNGDFYCGAAYLFTNFGGTWQQEQELLAFDQVQNDGFGKAVFFSGLYAGLKRIWVGAPGVDCAAGADCGAVYVYEENAGGIWTLEQKLIAFDQEHSDGLFGVAIAADGNEAWVGADDPCITGWPQCGSVYSFDWVSGWIPGQQLQAYNSESNAVGSRFGYSLAVDSSRLRVVVGVPGDSNHCAGGSDGCGAVNILGPDGLGGWTEVQQLSQTPPGTFYDKFGSSVSASNKNVVVVGAPYEDCADGEDCGAAYVFACGSPPPKIPALSEWGMVAMTLLVLAAGTVVLVRRRRSAA